MGLRPLCLHGSILPCFVYQVPAKILFDQKVPLLRGSWNSHLTLQLRKWSPFPLILWQEGFGGNLRYNPLGFRRDSSSRGTKEKGCGEVFNLCFLTLITPHTWQRGAFKTKVRILIANLWAAGCSPPLAPTETLSASSQGRPHLVVLNLTSMSAVLGVPSSPLHVHPSLCPQPSGAGQCIQNSSQGK